MEKGFLFATLFLIGIGAVFSFADYCVPSNFSYELSLIFLSIGGIVGLFTLFKYYR